MGTPKGPVCEPSKKHGRPEGPEVEFYLGANSQYKKGERIPVKVNGHRYLVTVGAKNSMPSEVVEVLQEAKSHTLVPDLDRYDPSRRGVPRKEEEFGNVQRKVSEQSDFDIEILNIRD